MGINDKRTESLLVAIPEKERHFAELEFMRVISFVAVVVQHILGAYSRRDGLIEEEKLVISLLFGMCKFAVPSFVFISGFVLFQKYYDRLIYPRFLIKRVSAVLMPYLCVSVLYLSYPDQTISNFIQNLLKANIAYHTWYVFLVIQFYLFLPVIFIFYRSVFNGSNVVLKVSLFCVAYITLLNGSFLFSDIPVMGVIMHSRRGNNFLFYLPYFMLGGFAANHVGAFRAFISKWYLSIGILSAICYVYIEIIFSQKIGWGNINKMGSFSNSFFIFSVTSLLLLYGATVMAATILPCGVKKMVNVFSSHTYVAYLVHVYVINECNRLLKNFDLSYPIFYIALTLLTIVLAILAATIFNTVFAVLKCCFGRGSKIHKKKEVKN